MTFEKVKSLLKNNKNIIEDFYSTRPRNFAFNFFERCISLLEEEKPREIDSEFLKDFSSILRSTIDLVIKSQTTAEEKEVLEAISNLLSNIASNYNIMDCSTDLNALSILVEISRSLEDLLFILIYLFGHISSRIMEEPSNNILSQKYYTELRNFLSNRISHDEKYSI